MQFTCPVCGLELGTVGNTMKCPSGHSFDVAKQGYVNLLMSQKSSAKHSGDDRLMVSARTAFLDKGYYDPLRDAICEILREHKSEISDILDVGCGECFYTCAAAQATGTDTAGIDISKHALIAASKRSKDIKLAVASVSDLPVPDASADLIMNLFAPMCESEFLRVLRADGYLLRAQVLRRHLFGLKAAVYANPYENPEPEVLLPGFEIVTRRDIEYSVTLGSNDDIQNLFKMTPYYYKTSKEDQDKLVSREKLETEIGFCLVLYRKET